METEWYCSENVRDLLYLYDYTKYIHGYISILLCVFGSITSLLSVVVLCQKNMVSSTNVILAGLAVADMFIMLAYVPYSIMFISIGYDDPPHFLATLYQYSWAIFRLIHSHFHRVCHAISVWITVILAVWRYVLICWPLKSRQWCGTRRAWWAVVATYVCVPIIFIPNYMMYEFGSEPIEKYYDEDDQLSISIPPSLAPSAPGMSSSSPDTVVGPQVVPTVAPPPPYTIVEATKYSYYTSSLAFDEDKDDNTLFFKLNQWMMGVLFRLLPCALLTVVSLRMAYALVEARKRRRTLVSAGTALSDADRKMHRTTRMLLVVLFFFLVTEIPQGVVAILTGTLHGFNDECSIHLQDVIDILVLMNSAINFVLYTTMSQEFRQTFKDLFVPKIKITWPLCCRWSRTTVSSHRAQPGSNSTASCDTSTVDLRVLKSCVSHDNALVIREDVRQVLDTVLLSHLDPLGDRLIQMQSSIDSLSTDVQDLRQFVRGPQAIHGGVLRDQLGMNNGSESSFATAEDNDIDGYSITSTEVFSEE